MEATLKDNASITENPQASAGPTSPEHRRPGGETAPNQSPKRITFAAAIASFTHDMGSMAEAFPVVEDALISAVKAKAKALVEYVKVHAAAPAVPPAEASNKEMEAIEWRADEWLDFAGLAGLLSKHQTAKSVVVRSFIVSLVSHFDAYVGRLIRCLFYAQPGLLHVSEKNVTFAQMLKFSTIEEAREYIVEKEVESVLRESHASHFDWLESKLKMTLRKELAVWPSFIEVTERRNLFVHTDGVVSSQYLAVCDAAGVQLAKRPNVGDTLTVTDEYFRSAYRTLFEIGIKLGHVLWRKVAPKEIDLADAALHQLTYELLKAGDYEVVINLADFYLTTIKRHASEEFQLLTTINLCIAYRELGKDDDCSSRLGEVDWGAKADKFKLAAAVLRKSETDVFKFMRKIGRNGEIEPWAYRSWPLFNKLRESKRFLDVFEEIFGEPLVIGAAVAKAQAAAAVEDLLAAAALQGSSGAELSSTRTPETDTTVTEPFPDDAHRDRQPVDLPEASGNNSEPTTQQTSSGDGV